MQKSHIYILSSGIILALILVFGYFYFINNPSNINTISTEQPNGTRPVCGNGICEDRESSRRCPDDCNIDNTNTNNNNNTNTGNTNTGNTNTGNNNNTPPSTPPVNCVDVGEKKIPLIDMTGSQCYHGEEGGLYGGGKNTPPETQRQAALDAISRIQPLDQNGQPSSSGKIVFMSLGMSNTEGEFGGFIDVVAKKNNINDKLILVNTAKFGMEATKWSTTDEPWIQAEDKLVKAGVTKKQAQAIWIKLAIGRPEGGFPTASIQLKNEIEIIVQRLKSEYPNMQIAYLASRAYGGYSDKRKNPEPYAYESGFAMRWVIEDQIAGNSGLLYTPPNAKAPVLVWGPYFWADGLTPRSDGLVWKETDFADGVHVGDTGMVKITDLMWNFFSTNELAKGWFLK